MEEKRFIPPKPPQALRKKPEIVQEAPQEEVPETVFAPEDTGNMLESNNLEYDETQAYVEETPVEMPNDQEMPIEQSYDQEQKKSKKGKFKQEKYYSPMVNWAGFIVSVAAVVLFVFFLITF